MPPPLSSTSVTACAATSDFADEELTILEKRRDEITNRIAFLVASKHSSQQATASATQAPTLAAQPYQNQAPMRSQAPQRIPRDTAQSNPDSNVNAFFRQQNQKQQQLDVSGLLAALSGNTPAPSPPPAPAAPPANDDLSNLLVQAGLSTLFQQAGAGGFGQPNGANLLSQLLQSAGAGDRSQPVNTPAAHTLENPFAQGRARIDCNRMPAPSTSSVANGQNTALQALMREGNIDLSMLFGSTGRRN